MVPHFNFNMLCVHENQITLLLIVLLERKWFTLTARYTLTVTMLSQLCVCLFFVNYGSTTYSLLCVYLPVLDISSTDKLYIYSWYSD